MLVYTLFRNKKSEVLKENLIWRGEKKLKICSRRNGYISKASILSKSTVVSKGDTLSL